ncbi:hypothetical protein [Neobacillus sp. D3-1R]|uniref:hypothetical protein n=1 Tax=Neobacillus sp. D3-1R TaxID=3445778 RepID=UPI003F9F2462
MKWKLIIATLMMLFITAGCGNENDVSKQVDPGNESTNTNSNKTDPIKSENGSIDINSNEVESTQTENENTNTTSKEDEDVNPADEAETKDIIYMDNGEQRTYPGTLYKSDLQNLQLYLLPGFGANSDSVKGLDVVWNADSDEEKMEIKNHGKEDQQPIVDKGKDDFVKIYGSVKEDKSRLNDKFYQNAVILQASNEQEKIVKIIVPIQGDLFEITFRQSEKIANDEYLFAMIKTILPATTE